VKNAPQPQAGERFTFNARVDRPLSRAVFPMDEFFNEGAPPPPPAPAAGDDYFGGARDPLHFPAPKPSPKIFPTRRLRMELKRSRTGDSLPCYAECEPRVGAGQQSRTRASHPSLWSNQSKGSQSRNVPQVLVPSTLHNQRIRFSAWLPCVQGTPCIPATSQPCAARRGLPAHPPPGTTWKRPAAAWGNLASPYVTRACPPRLSARVEIVALLCSAGHPRLGRSKRDFDTVGGFVRSRTPVLLPPSSTPSDHPTGTVDMCYPPVPHPSSTRVDHPKLVRE